MADWERWKILKPWLEVVSDPEHDHAKTLSLHG